MKSFKAFTETPIDEACWKGYEKKGMKTMFGKRYPNCVKKKATRKEETEVASQTTPDPNLKSKEKKQAQIKKMVLRKKMQAVRAGAGSDIVASYEPSGEMVEGSLHKWFSGSKSKDGKPGWVQSDGSPCANEPGETKTPKCYSSAKRASMSKKELRSADARKSKKDPNQQQKSGAAKPTYVATDKKKVKEENEVDECWKTHKKVGMKMKGGKMVPDCRPKNEEVVLETKDKKGKGSGTKDACYHKVKARYSVWPSAYASGALVKCRRKGAANWGNSTKKEEVEYTQEAKDLSSVAKELDKASKMHKGQANKLRKHAEDMKEASTPAWQRKEGKKESGGLNQKGVDSYRRANPGSKLKTAVTTKPSKLKKGSKAANRRKSFCARMGGMKKRLTSAKTARDPDSRINKALRKWNCSYEPQGTPIMEQDRALDFVRKSIEKKHGKGAIYDPKKDRPPTEAQKKKVAVERKKRQDADNKAYAARAKKAGFKSTQDYTNVVARYGSEDNYRKGKGLGT